MKRSELLARLAMIIGALCLIWSATTLAAPLDAGTMWKIKRLGSPALSPDGTKAVVPVTTYDTETDEGRTELWLIPTDGGDARPLTTGGASGGRPAWSLDGKHLAFTARREGDGSDQVYVMPAAGGEARRLTAIPGDAAALKWFPDSSRIAFITRLWPEAGGWDAQTEKLKARDESKMTAMVWDKAPIRWWDHWIDDRETHVFAVRLDGSPPEGITTGTGLRLTERNTSTKGPGLGAYDLSPDGEEIAFVTDTDETGVEPNYDVFVMPVAGGEPVNVTADNPAGDFGPLYSPDGRWLVFRRQLVKRFSSDRQRLMRMDRRSKETRELAADWDRSFGGLVWHPDSRRLYGAIDDAGNQRVYEFTIRDGEVRAVTGEKSFSGLAVAGKTPVLVGLRQSFIEPNTLVRVDPKNGKATKLSDFNDALLADVDPGTYESVTYEGANGEPVQMWINYPPGFSKDRKWPLYLLIHGGPHNGIKDSFHYRWNAQVFSGWGYVTAWHNFHGSSGFGQAFTDSINPIQGDLPYEDTILAAEYFAGQPWIDPDRMAAGGGSFGGYMASILLGREHPFKTLIAHAAVYNRLTQYGSDYGARKRRFGEHWEEPEIFARWSPHTGAGNFETPTLVIHGESDYRVPLNHGIELFNTLQNRGVRSRLVYFPNQNHWILTAQDSIFWYAQKRDWLEDFIGRGPSNDSD